MQKLADSKPSHPFAVHQIVYNKKTFVVLTLGVWLLSLPASFQTFLPGLWKRQHKLNG